MTDKIKNVFLYQISLLIYRDFFPAALLVNLNSNVVRISLTAGRDYCQLPKETLPLKDSILYKNFVSFLLFP